LPIPPAGRDLRIDTLRALAALAVCWHHLNAPQLPPDLESSTRWLSAITRHGYLGVSVFFVISGLCIGHVWQRANSAGEFLFFRLRRIFPPYWASLVLIVALALLARWRHGINDMTPHPLPTSAVAWLATLTLFTEPATAIKSINWVYWSLSYEVAFYLTLGAAFFCPPRFRANALILLTLSSALIAVFVGRNTGSQPFYFGLWPQFVLGVAVAYKTTEPNAARRLAAAAIVAVLVVAFSTHPRHALIVADSSSAGGLTALGTWLILLLPTPPAIILFRALAWLGIRSYSLYLIHVPLGVYLGHRWLVRAQPNALVFFLGIIAITLLLIIAADLFYRVCEKPFVSRPKAIKEHNPQP
jgi:peptidoglycan/LPS O-acetylase OafA/YrhL